MVQCGAVWCEKGEVHMLSVLYLIGLKDRNYFSKEMKLKTKSNNFSFHLKLVFEIEQTIILDVKELSFSTNSDFLISISL